MSAYGGAAPAPGNAPVVGAYTSSPKIPRLHVDRSFDPQIGDVDISGLAPERIARLWPATVLRSTPSAMRQREALFALSDRAEQAGEVDEVLGNHVNDLPLSLQ